MKLGNQLKRWAAGLLALVVLAGCGPSNLTKVTFNRVYVMGDSLADIGTFGFKYTVQNDGAAIYRGYKLWPQWVASALGVDDSKQCGRYFGYTLDSGDNFSLISPFCNFSAVAGGRIVLPSAKGDAQSKKIINLQLFDQVQQWGNYGQNDLVMVEVGANDVADLATAYISVLLGGLQGTPDVAAAAQTAFQAFLAQQLDTNTIAGLNFPADNAKAAGLYMSKLADTFYSQIKANVLDKGATHVVAVNMPDITLTPKFGAVLKTIRSAGGANGATNAAVLQLAIQAWITAYNSRLQANIAQDQRVLLVDFYSAITAWNNDPYQYALVNVTDPVCPGTPGNDSSYDLKNNCSDKQLDATPGKIAGWWKNYAYSDHFHPTPYGHQLLAETVKQALTRVGWL